MLSNAEQCYGMKSDVMFNALGEVYTPKCGENSKPVLVLILWGVFSCHPVHRENMWSFFVRMKPYFQELFLWNEQWLVWLKGFSNHSGLKMDFFSFFDA